MKTAAQQLCAPLDSLAAFALPAVAPSEACGDVQPHAAALHEILGAKSVVPLDPAPERDEARWKLGQALFFDPVLGCNRDIFCATGDPNEVGAILGQNEEEIWATLSFLHSLTSPSASELGHLIPGSLPSGLDLIDPAPMESSE